MGNKTFKDLVSDKNFMQNMINQPTMEDAKKLFEDEGVSMTDKEMETLRVIIGNTLSKGELSEEDFNAVVGAGTTAKVVGGLIGAGLGAAVLVPLGAKGGAIIGGTGGAVTGAAAGCVAGAFSGQAADGALVGTTTGGGIGATVGGLVGAGAGVVAGAAGGAALANWIVGDSGKKKRKCKVK